MDRGGTVVVIGAGIVGIAAAARLAEAGCEVIVVDRSGVCEGTSAGNAAALAFSDVLPLSQKGMIRNLPRWLADPLGPLAIPPSYFPTLLPWLVRFLVAGRPARHDAALDAQASLMRLAEVEWTSLLHASGTEDLLREDGSLELYESEAEFRASLPGWEARRQHAIAFRHVARGGIEELQPGLAETFTHGTFVPGWKTVADPKVLGQRVWDHARRLGASLRIAEATAIEWNGERPRCALAGGETIAADRVVMAAGAWSHRLAASLGDRIPLETERGYNTTLPAGAFALRRQLIFSSHGFVVTPLENGIRVGGAVELGGLDRAPDFRRSKAMLEKAARFMPGLKTSNGVEWMGYRPSLPDSLPVIGTARRDRRVIYAFGHGHLGLTQAAATARLVAALVSGENPAIDLAPFSPDRF